MAVTFTLVPQCLDLWQVTPTNLSIESKTSVTIHQEISTHDDPVAADGSAAGEFPLNAEYRAVARKGAGGSVRLHEFASFAFFAASTRIFAAFGVSLLFLPLERGV